MSKCCCCISDKKRIGRPVSCVILMKIRIFRRNNRARSDFFNGKVYQEENCLADPDRRRKESYDGKYFPVVFGYAADHGQI